MKSYIPKNWRSVTKSIDPKSKPTSSIPKGLAAKLPASMDAYAYKGRSSLTVRQLIEKLEGRTTFTLAEVAELLELDNANRIAVPAGSPEFRAIIGKLMLAGRVTAGSRGRSANVAEATTAAVAELDNLDF